jgi:YebC/PmpR family DNA-binding regulatory protein
MSAHYNWAKLNRATGAHDAKRGALFTKLGREIVVAVKAGGPDPAANFRLRLAVQRARDNNMPADTIDRAIKRAAGGGDEASLDEVTYEGYGPGGIAVMVEALTDNRNRTAASMRAIFERGGGSVGTPGSVGWQFKSRGRISVPLDGKDAEEIELAAIEAGATDVQSDADEVTVETEPTEVENVRRALSEQGFTVSSADLAMIPENMVELDEAKSAQALRLLDWLESDDDVQNVYTNADFSEAALAAFNA